MKLFMFSLSFLLSTIVFSQSNCNFQVNRIEPNQPIRGVGEYYLEFLSSSILNKDELDKECQKNLIDEIGQEKPNSIKISPEMKLFIHNKEATASLSNKVNIIRTYNDNFIYDIASVFIKDNQVYKIIIDRESYKELDDDISNDELLFLDFAYHKNAYKSYKEKEYDEALEQINLALEINPEKETYYSLKAYIYVHTNEREKAIETTTEGLKKFPQSDELYELRANVKYFLLDIDGALADYKSAISLEPTVPRYYNNILKALTESNRYNETIEYFTAFDDLYSKGKIESDEGRFIGDIYFYGGIAYYFLDDFEKAIEVFTKAISKSEYHSYYSNRGLAYADLEKYDEAIADYTKAIEINPLNVAAYQNRALAYLYKEQYELSINDYLKVKSLGENDVWVNLNLAISYGALNKFEDAIRYYRLVLKTNKKNPIIWGNYAYCFYALGDYQEALISFTKAYSLNNKEVDVLIGLALTNYKLDQNELAKEYINQINTNTSYKANSELLESLEKDDYEYSDDIKKDWKNLIENLN